MRLLAPLQRPDSTSPILSEGLGPSFEVHPGPVQCGAAGVPYRGLPTGPKVAVSDWPLVPCTHPLHAWSAAHGPIMGVATTGGAMSSHRLFNGRERGCVRAAGTGEGVHSPPLPSSSDLVQQQLPSFDPRLATRTEGSCVQQRASLLPVEHKASQLSVIDSRSKPLSVEARNGTRVSHLCSAPTIFTASRRLS